MTSAKRIGSRWSWVPRLAGEDAAIGVQPSTIIHVFPRPHRVGTNAYPYTVALDDGRHRYANDRCLWPLGSIVRPGASA